MDFQTCFDTLTFLGAQPIRAQEYRDQPDGTRLPFDLDLLRTLRLPLDAEEWCALCMRVGTAYIGGCCANLVGAQELLHKAFLEGGWMPLTDLKSFIEIVSEHGDVDSEEWPIATPDPQALIERARAEWANLGPVDKIVMIWHIARGHMTSKVPRVVRDANEAEGALHVLSQGIRHLNAHLLIQRVLGDEGQPSPVQLLGLYRLWPSLKTAYESFQTLNPGPMHGWVFVNPEDPNNPASSDIGTSFHNSLDDVKELIREWMREAELHQDVWGKDQREAFKSLLVREVNVSAEHGLVFLPSDAVPVSALV